MCFKSLNEFFKILLRTAIKVLTDRSPKSQLKLKCPNVSKQYCILTYSDDGWRIRDNVENSESLRNVGNDRVSNLIFEAKTDGFMQLDTAKACSLNGCHQKLENSKERLKKRFEKSKEMERLKSKLAILTEEIENLKKSEIELLRCYEYACKKNRTLDLQLASQAKLQEELKLHEIKEAKKEVKSELLERFEDDFVCHICTELFIKPTILECSHTFCEFCINVWRNTKNDCPLCRCKIQKMTRVVSLEKFLDKTLATLTPEQRDKRDELIAARYLEHPPEINATSPTSTSQIGVDIPHYARMRTSSINDQFTPDRIIPPPDLPTLNFHGNTFHLNTLYFPDIFVMDSFS